MLVSWFCVQAVLQHCSTQKSLHPQGHCWFCAQWCSGELWWGKGLRILPQIDCSSSNLHKCLHGMRAGLGMPFPITAKIKRCWMPPDSLSEAEWNSSMFALHLYINRFWKNNRRRIKSQGLSSNNFHKPITSIEIAQACHLFGVLINCSSGVHWGPDFWSYSAV